MGEAHRSSGGWAVLMVLLTAVLVPTACVLWFMSAAMRNERLAVRQKLTDVYHRQLLAARERLDEHWSATLRTLNASSELPPAKAFETLVQSGTADSVIVYDASGELAYPVRIEYLPEPTSRSPQWDAARRMEQSGEFLEAADAYGQLATLTSATHTGARYYRAQARCLARAGKHPEAGRVLTSELSRDEYRDARDQFGRLIAPDALLFAIQLMPPGDPHDRPGVVDDLLARIIQYDGPLMPSSQRLFLMMQLQEQTGVSVPMLKAEQLAADYVDVDAPRPIADGLRLAASGELWALASSDTRTVALFTSTTVARITESLAPKKDALAGARVVAHVGRAPDTSDELFLSVRASDTMDDWWMSVYLEGDDPFTAAAAEQNAVYLWTGATGIALVALLGLGLGSYLRRQIKLTRLKNDLIATVSHELKTPLASMRVLVDTLRENRTSGEHQVSEYFDLIVRENERLSRLIDNFLTFSRMERNKRAFAFAKTDANEVAQTAANTVGERFSSPKARLHVELSDDLPTFRADRDAMITVVLNLLDNAWKYTGDQKDVRLRTYTIDGNVCIEVSDNGEGMSRRAVRRVFDKFYQVDQALSRKAGGCGLGLSIVKFILDAHGGTISVKSEPGKSSTFTISVPAECEPTSGQRTRAGHGG